MSWIEPDWPAPARVRALSTLRYGAGSSKPPWDSFNLAMHVGDDPACVAANRHQLMQEAALPAEPLWLEQVHGSRVVDAASAAAIPQADGSFASVPGTICTVMTADCLPLLLCHAEQPWVAAVHCGWRGVAGGIIDNALGLAPPGPLLAWMGPAIGSSAFEVGEDVRAAFTGYQEDLQRDFHPAAEAGKWQLDLYRAVFRILQQRAPSIKVSGGGFCTHQHAERFFSYRRDGRTGRMASLIWLQ